MANTQHTQQEFTGRKMAMIMALFFGTIIAVNLTMAWFANSSWSGLVVKNSYVASQEFEETTRELERQHALGWKAKVEYHSGLVDISIIDGDERSILFRSLTARIGRSVTEVDDRDIPLVETAPGKFQGKVDLKNGAWVVSLSGESVAEGHWTQQIQLNVGG